MRLENEINIIFNESDICEIEKILNDFKNIEINQFYSKYKELLNLDNCIWFEFDTEKNYKSDNDINLMIVWLMKEHNLLIEAEHKEMSVMYAENILKFVNNRIKNIGIKDFHVKESNRYVLSIRSLIININKELSEQNLRAISFTISEYIFIGVFKSEISYKLVNAMENMLIIEDIDSALISTYIPLEDLSNENASLGELIDMNSTLQKTLIKNFNISKFFRSKLSDEELMALNKTFEAEFASLANLIELEIVYFVQLALTHINNYVFDVLAGRKNIDIECNEKFFKEKMFKMLLTYKYPSWMRFNCKFSRKFERLLYIKKLSDAGEVPGLGFESFINNLKEVMDYIDSKS